jgi:hypothetical protein
MSAQEEGIGFALANWIKHQQEEKLEFEASRARSNFESDKEFVGMIDVLMKTDIKARDKMILNGMLMHKKKGFVLSPAQRSVIANIYYKYI